MGNTSTVAKSDRDLTRAVQTGDKTAFNELCEKYYGSLRRSAIYLVGTNQAEDLVQEAITTVFEFLTHGGGPIDSFRAYVYTTMWRQAARWGKTADISMSAEDLESFIEAVVSVEDIVMKNFERELMRDLFKSMRERDRLLLWNCDVEQIPHTTVAAHMALSKTAVSTGVWRARENLRQLYVDRTSAS